VNRFLVDTHVWLWMMADTGRLSERTRALVRDPATLVMLSVASAWEIAIKYRLGKLDLPVPQGAYVPDRLRRTGGTAVGIEIDHVLRVADLPDHHRDPFDRVLIAQAQALRVPLITADPVFGPDDVDVLAP
jgi:PIN domain nuclease of toxin-antitoxin system